MVNHHHPKILVIGYREANVTFLNRLLQGLMENGCDIYMASNKCQEGKASKRSQQCLWTPPIKGWRFGKWIYLIFSFLSSLGTKRSSWLKTQISKGIRLKDKIGIFIRYAPFCRQAFDVFYFPWNSAAIAYRGLFELGIPTVVSCRGSQVNISPHLPGQDAYVSGLQDTLQQASTVHCVSENILQSVLDLGVTQEHFAIIRPAVDPDFFIPPDHPPHNPRLTLVSTGSLIWRKSYEIMLAALKHLVDAGIDAELHIIGEGPERQHILYTVYDLGLEDRVFLHGRLKPNEVLIQLQNADAFVLSSLSEGIANAVLEAMSCGLPIVTTDCGGMREALTDGVEGFVVPIRDPLIMADAMLKLAINPELRAKMGAASRSRVLTRFNINDQIDDFKELFITLVAPHHRSESNDTR